MTYIYNFIGIYCFTLKVEHLFVYNIQLRTDLFQLTNLMHKSFIL